MKAYHTDPYQSKNFPETCSGDARMDPEAWWTGAQWDIPSGSAITDKDIVKKLKTMGARTKIMVIKDAGTRYELDVKTGKKTPWRNVLLGTCVEQDHAAWAVLPAWRRWLGQHVWDFAARHPRWLSWTTVERWFPVKRREIKSWIASTAKPDDIRLLIEAAGWCRNPLFVAQEAYR